MSMSIRSSQPAFAALLLSALTAGCGGSGSGSISPQPDQTAIENASSQDATSLTANVAPTIGGEPAQALEAGDLYLFMPLASDADGDSLTFAVENLPAWATFDAATGAITGIPDDSDVGIAANIAIIVSDGMASTRLAAFSVTVNEAAPRTASIVINWLPPVENEDGSSLTDLAAYRIYYGRNPDDLNRVVQIDNPGLATYVIENLRAGTWFIGATALNGAGLESDLSNIAEISIG